MNPRKLLATLVAFLLIAGVAVGLSLLTPARMPAPETVELPRTTRLTCLQAGDALVQTGGTARAATLDGEELFTVSGDGVFPEVAAPFVVSADALAVAGVHTSGSPSAYAPCAPADTSGALLVTDPGTAELVITNSDATEAVVDLTLLGPDGEVSAVGARGIAVAPGVSRRIALSVLAPEGPVGVVYTASQGRVAMAAVNLEGRPHRFVGATGPASQHLIGGIPADASDAQLLLTNAREERAEITVTALGATSSYELAATADLSVEPMTTVAVPIGESLGGEASALRIESTQDVSVAVLVSGRATLLPAEPATEVGATTLGGALQITNPGDTPATVTSLSPPLTVEPGTTVVLPEQGEGPVVVSADAPVLASMVVLDEAGAVVVPLGRLADEPRAAGTTVLDPHLR